MSECNNCLCHHHICEAECCKEIRVRINPHAVFRKGQIIEVDRIDAQNEWYMSLRGFIIFGGKVLIRLNEFHKKGRYLIVKSRCRLLKENNQCMEYESGNRPEVCKRDYTKGEDKLLYITDNCLWSEKWKKQKQKKNQTKQEN